LAQTRPVDEIVVVDDGSTDQTALVAARYASAGVRYIYQKNQGPSVARNRGIAETSGEWLSFLDSDDIWLLDKIARQEDYLETHPDIGLVSGSAWWWDVVSGKRWVVHRGIGPRQNIAHEIAVRNVIGNTSLVLLRRFVLQKSGLFNPTVHWGEDREFWIRVVSHTKVGFIPEPLIIYRRHPASNSRTIHWEQFKVLFATSYHAVQQIQPAWQRPFLLARAWSNIELHRANYLLKQNSSRFQQLWHAGCAFLAYPFEDASRKVKVVLRALIGNILYDYVHKSKRQFNEDIAND
jgi:glycosyltransferase involved in cell wall biosynthesis